MTTSMNFLHDLDIVLHHSYADRRFLAHKHRHAKNDLRTVPYTEQLIFHRKYGDMRDSSTPHATTCFHSTFSMHGFGAQQMWRTVLSEQTVRG